MVFDSQTLLVIEWTAAALGVINIALLIFRSVWNFPFGIAMVALYIFVFFEERLYAEAGLQVFFILAQAWGWWLWVRIGGENDRVPVRWLDWLSRGVWIMVTAAVSVNLGWAMHELTNAVLPYADAGIAGASVAAQILLAYRRIENWLIWIAIDVASIALYIDRGLYPTAGLYGGFLVLSLIGLREWIAAEQRSRAAPAA
ncbi:MAG TPA: nicotinamide riboside transporter PnuC [Croceibacterium sp.]